jgi:hypothetical protein
MDSQPTVNAEPAGDAPPPEAAPTEPTSPPDAAATEPASPPPPEGVTAPPPAPGRWRRPWDYWALWVVALISLALNGFFLYEQWTLLNLLRAQAPVVESAAEQVRVWRMTTIEYAFEIDQTVPVVTNVVISQTLSVPISTTLPVNTQVQIPINVAGFSQVLRVPVNATIPVQLETQVPLNLTVPVRADVPVRTSVPIRIAVADTPADETLALAEARLDALSAELRQLEFGQLLQRLAGGSP